MVYGSSIRLPSELFQESKIDVDPTTFVSRLKQQMASLQPTATKHHTSSKPFVAPQLNTCTHVFVRTDAVKKPVFEGPCKVLERSDKYFTVSYKNRPVNISLDLLKPAFMLNDSVTEHDHPYASYSATSHGHQKNKTVTFKL